MTEPSQVTTVFSCCIQLIISSPFLVSQVSCAFLCESKVLLVSGPQSSKRRWMLRHWLAAASGVCPGSRRPTLLPCRPNICAPRLILQKVDDTAAGFQRHHTWERLLNAAWIYTSNHLVCRNISSYQHLADAFITGGSDTASLSISCFENLNRGGRKRLLEREFCRCPSSRDPAPRGERPDQGAALHGLGVQLHDPAAPDGTLVLGVPRPGGRPLPRRQWLADAPPVLQPQRAQLAAAAQACGRYGSSRPACIRGFCPHILKMCLHLSNISHIHFSVMISSAILWF